MNEQVERLVKKTWSKWTSDKTLKHGLAPA